MKIALKIIASILIGCIAALAFGILPCYIFPYFGGSTSTWYGSRSEPPYFFIQLIVGFMVGILVSGFLVFRKRK